VRSPHIQATIISPEAGTNVAVVTAMGHVIVTEGLVNEAYVRERCDWDEFQDWAAFVAEEHNSPRRWSSSLASPPPTCGRARLRHGRKRRDLLRPWRDEHSQGSTTVMAIANLAMATGNLGPACVGVEPTARTEQRAGLLRHGFVPARAARLPAYIGLRRRVEVFECGMGRQARSGARPAHPKCSTLPSTARSRAFTCGRGHSFSPIPDTKHVSAGLAAMELVVVQDLFLVDGQLRPVFLPGATFLGKGRHFHQCGAAHPAA